jgi:general secretion pathway protein D
MNALLEFANAQDIEMIEDIVSKLDVVQAQVLIEAIILDVALSDSFNMGVTMLNRHQSGNLSGTAISRSGPSLLQTVTNIAGAGGSGFSYFANWSDDLEIALNMLASDSKVNVLSRPRIQTSHAEPASLFIGQTRPYVTGAFDTGFGSRTQFQQTQIGIRLNVLPLINQDGLVVLEIQQQVQELGEEVPIDDNFSVPATIDRTAEAKVAVRDGDTIILGGFISTRKDNTKSGVPVLKDIPLLGALFRSTTKEDRRSELMVLIRPTVLPTPEVASLAVQDERSRLPGIRQAEAENRLEQQRRQRAADEAIRKMEMEELRRTLGIKE